jgi:acetoin utilization deacetylase AcuC-like enzyme
MNFGYLEECLEHDTGEGHPESADRLPAIRKALTESHGIEYSAPLPADIDEILAVHDREYVEALKKFCARGGGRWDADTVASVGTWKAALASAGLAKWAASEALDGHTGNDTPFALSRPPGHHALSDDAMGFCFFNNVAVGSQSVLDSGAADRVAVIDWDVHHGNGTQEIFYDQGDVFYVSLHEDGIYPGTGTVDETGEGDGEMRTMNLPLPPGSTSNAHLTALEVTVYPALRAFDPDLLFVSAGFDAHEHDPISRMTVSTEGFGRLASAVRTLAGELDAGLAFSLEGGYGLETLSNCVRMVHEVFTGYEPTTKERVLSETVEQLLDDVHAQGYPRVD